MLVDQNKLDLYVKKNFNVLFEGERGVGKTSVIYSTFEKAGLRIKYFSAPTMDPWTDLVGVPTTVTRADGKEVLRLVPPEDFADDKYDVIFIDELNRAPKKVMNALMELIQFKTINGKPYNIKMIWAAINPHTEDEDYHVEPLDPAVRDRFQIQIKVPYKVDIEFFTKNYGIVGETFCSWWNNQPEGVKKEISPRRLYETTGFYIDGGDIEDMINVGNIAKLKEDLKSNSQILLLEKDYKEKVVSASKSILTKNYSPNVAKYLKSSSQKFEFFLPYLDKEWLAKEFLTKDKVYNFLLKINKEGKEETKEISKMIIESIVQINPGKNPFVRNNLEELGGFLPVALREEYEQIKTIGLGDLSHKSQQEHNFIKTIGEFNLIKNGNITGSDLIRQYNWSNAANMIRTGMNAVSSGHIPEDRVAEQIANRLGALLSIVKAQGNINASVEKVIESLTNKNHKSYVWSKSNIDSKFKDMGEKIVSAMEKFDGLSKEEIQIQYLDSVVPQRAKKNAKPR